MLRCQYFYGKRDDTCPRGDTREGCVWSPKRASYRRGATISLITVALSTTIGARAEDVWRALTDPQERLAWDERILGEVALSTASARGNGRTGRREPAASEKRSGDRVRWRFLFGGVPMVLKDEVASSEAPTRRVSRMTIGSMHFDQTVTLYSEDDETGPHTRLGMKLVADNSIAVIGEVIPRLDVQKIVIEYVDTTLRQIQKYCER